MPIQLSETPVQRRRPGLEPVRQIAIHAFFGCERLQHCSLECRFVPFRNNRRPSSRKSRNVGWAVATPHAQCPHHARSGKLRDPLPNGGRHRSPRRLRLRSNPVVIENSRVGRLHSHGQRMVDLGLVPSIVPEALGSAQRIVAQQQVVARADYAVLIVELASSPKTVVLKLAGEFRAGRAPWPGRLPS